MARSKTDQTPGANVRARLHVIASNLWWAWNAEARSLLVGVEPTLWEACGRNPVAMLRRVAPERLAALAADTAFVRNLAACEDALRRYLLTSPWFGRKHRGADGRLLTAYFCSEYALDDCLPQYAGGLGVLAGDHLKSASDLGVPLIGVGLLYRHGYFRQEFAPDGRSRSVFPEYDFADWPVRPTGLSVPVEVGTRRILANIWQVQVGRVLLLLLDTDHAKNRPADRAITGALYGGDDDLRIRQQIVLGIGGVRALAALKIRPTVYHLNEGHAAFCQLARLDKMMTTAASRADAIAQLRAATVFTTHTPVPAGNQRFDNRMVMKYLGPLAARLGYEREEFLDLGRETPGNRKESLCMTVLALRLSAHCNGVAALHGEVSRKMWLRVYDAKTPAQVPIGHVTNGIHSQTWLAPEALELYEKYLRPRWLGAAPDSDWWKNAERIPPAALWEMRNRLRRRLVHFIRGRLRDQTLRNSGSKAELSAAYDTFDESALTIGFARRFATYKRAPLIFHNAARLAAILNAADRPVQLVFAGKAHPRDMGGQAYAQEIYRFARKSGFAGRVVLLENYDMNMGQYLTSGCDVWLNNPIRPQEASGTSGMKPPLHGGVNCSILDGWWPEGLDGTNGWAIGDGRELRSQAAQDRYDAVAIYELLESKIVPLFYRRDRAGIPIEWVRMALRSMKTVCAAFSSHRMVGEYVEKYYLPAHRAGHAFASG